MELADTQAVEAFSQQSSAVLLGLAPKGSDEFLQLQKVAMGLDDIPVGYTSLPEVVNKYAPAKVVMLQKFDEGIQKFDGDFTAENLKKWAVVHSLPTVSY